MTWICNKREMRDELFFECVVADCVFEKNRLSNQFVFSPTSLLYLSIITFSLASYQLKNHKTWLIKRKKIIIVNFGTWVGKLETLSRKTSVGDFGWFLVSVVIKPSTVEAKNNQKCDGLLLGNTPRCSYSDNHF